MIPGHCEVVFNFRYNPGWQAEALEREVHAVLDRHGLTYDIRWHRGGEPFLTREGALRRAAREVLVEHCGVTPDENTGGGTSDARFIAPLGAEVVEVADQRQHPQGGREHIGRRPRRVAALYLRLIERLLA